MNNELNAKNNLAYQLHSELLKTAGKFSKKCPKTDAEVILGAGNMYVAGFLINAPSKEEALRTLESCYETMKNLLDVTPDYMFGGGSRLN